MFKKFLLLFPYFQRWEKSIAAEEESARLWQEKFLASVEREKQINDAEDKWQYEVDRRRGIRESLLENQKFLKLRISRQTF